MLRCCDEKMAFVQVVLVMRVLLRIIFLGNGNTVQTAHACNSAVQRLILFCCCLVTFVALIQVHVWTVNYCCSAYFCSQYKLSPFLQCNCECIRTVLLSTSVCLSVRPSVCQMREL